MTSSTAIYGGLEKLLVLLRRRLLLVTSSTLVLVVMTMLLLALVPRPPTSPRIRDHPPLPVPVLRVRGPRVRRLRRLLRAAPRDLLHPAVAAAAVARLGLSSG